MTDPIMEKEKFTMNLKVAGRPYRLNIRAEKEELYRLAEKEVNRYVEDFKKGNYKGFEDRDYIALAAIHLAIDAMRMRQAREVVSADLKALERLNRSLDDYLNEVKTELAPER